MSMIRFNSKRAGYAVSMVVCLVLALMINIILHTGLLEGLDTEADKEGKLLKGRAEMKVTMEGQFVDCNGEAITEAKEPGKEAEILFDESYSYLIGNRKSRKEIEEYLINKEKKPKETEACLRRLMTPYILLGGEDRIGAKVTLTTNNYLQEYCYDLLGNREGSVIIMDPHTGELLACTSRSSADLGFDADLYNEKYNLYSKKDAFFYNRNTFTEDPPGSTFKIITAAALLENGMGDYTVDDLTGSYTLPGKKPIHNHDGRPLGAGVTLEKALNESCNVYFASAGVELGMSRLKGMLNKFQFEKSIATQIGTIESIFYVENKSDPHELAQAGFGQGGLAMSPLHISMVMGTVLNDGVMTVPYVIKSIEDDGRDVTNVYYNNGDYTTSYDVFSEDTAATLKKYLHSTALKYGYTEELYGTVYAKTGTADMHNGKNHAYMLIGLETDTRDYVILIDVRNISGSSGTLKPDGHDILSVLVNLPS